jgi:hypothetical protein
MSDEPLAEVFRVNSKERAPVEPIYWAGRRKAFCHGSCRHRTEKLCRFTGFIFGSEIP